MSDILSTGEVYPSRHWGRHLTSADTLLPGRHPPSKTPPLGRHTPSADTPRQTQLSRHPPGRHPLGRHFTWGDTFPWADTPTGQTPPLGTYSPGQTDNPLWADTPLGRHLPTPLPADGYCCRLYLSYCNAVLLSRFINSNLITETIAFHTVLTSYDTISFQSAVLYNEVLLNEDDG